MRKWWNILKWTLTVLLSVVILFMVYFFVAIQIDEPEIDSSLIVPQDLKQWNDTTFSYQDAWLRKNRQGLWEMYISGSPEELGIKNGILAQNLIRKQEEAFVEQLQHMIPSDNYLKFLKYVTAYMNRRLPEYIPDEYLQEIKAVSLFASEDFSFIGENYERQLNYTQPTI